MQKGRSVIQQLGVFSLFLFCSHSVFSASMANVAIQEDGSFIVRDAQGGIAEFVKQGTPRQSIQLNGQSCNVSFGFNSAGKKTILVSLPASASSPVNFHLEDSNVTLPPKSGLRITLSDSNRVDRMDGNPSGMVIFEKTPSPANLPTPQPPTQTSPVPTSVESAPSTAPQTEVPPLNLPTPESTSSLMSPETNPVEMEIGWPGKLLEHPISTSQIEEDMFYVRTEGGARFVSAMNIVNIVGPGGSTNKLIEKEVAFSTGYRQDVDIGAWVTPWFGLAIETGFALNAMRGNTQGMTVSSSTYWSVPIMAQLCFQYPNETGFVPYLNLGFGGGWNYFNIGSISYPPAKTPNYTATLSGAGNDMNNAYQIAAGVRWRIWEQLGLTLAYKFYGTSQPTVDMGDDQQVTFGSPVTNSVELGGNFTF
jgi:opacity protein-like surface antigen